MAIPENKSWQEADIYFTEQREKWTESQCLRAKILFDEYPDLEKAYNLSDKLRKIYNQTSQNPWLC